MIGKDPGHVALDEAICTRETDRAILVGDLNDEHDARWIPKSQIHKNSEVWKEAQTGRVIVSSWFAEQKGWL